jgi:integrase
MPQIRSPKYRRQKRSAGDLAFVEIAGVRRYLGVFNSPESMNAFYRVVAEWLEGGRSRLLPATSQEITVAELVAKYWEHAQTYFRRADGIPTRELDLYKQSFKPLLKLYENSRVFEFGPRALKSVRQQMIESGTLNRKTVNGYTTRVKALFKWGVEQELVPPSVWHGLQVVAGLRRGRTEAREPKRVHPVLQAHIDAVQPFVSQQVWALIQLQLFTAARAGELSTMRGTEIDTSGSIWIFQPADHKTAHHDIERNIYMGPHAQEIVQPFMAARPIGDYLFSPIEATRERYAEAECHRRPDQKPNLRKTERELGDHYTTGSYRRAINRACIKANIPSWHPHQLRHNAAIWLRKEFGLDVARIILGHRSPAITEIYAELDREKAISAMQKSG